jgi:hypothetical protein
MLALPSLMVIMDSIIDPGDFYIDVLRRCIPRIAGATVSIREMTTGKPEVLGSGIVAQLYGSTYILTAAHVAEDIGQLVVPLESKFVRLFGEMWTVSYKEMTEHQNVGDLAVIKLDTSSEAQLLEFYRPITKKEVTTWKEVNSGDILITHGVPASKSKSHAGENRDRPLSYIGLVPNAEKSKALCLDPTTNVALSYNKSHLMSESGRVTPSKLNGMSGSGLWMVPNVLASKPSVLLVGILTEYRASTIIGIHICIAAELLRDLCNANFPARDITLNITTRKVT